MMRKLLLLMLLTPLFLQGQDIHFSQFIYSPLNLSPSNTGLFDGDIRATALYRRQWNSITVPYKTFSFSYDQAINSNDAVRSRNAAGIVINNDKAGDGNFGTLNVLLSAARLFPLGSDSVHFLNAGLQAGIGYRSLDEGKLRFDNQFNGDVYDAQISSGEHFDRINYIYPEIHAGISWMMITSFSTTTAGISIQHLFSPEQTFFDESARLPLRLQAAAGTWLNRNGVLSFQPSVLFMQQNEFNELTFGTEAKLQITESIAKRNAVSLSLHYRLNDAVIPAVGVYYNLWRFGISYDINTSSLQSASNNKGGPEFSITYIMKKIRYVPTKKTCPVY